MSAVQGGPRFEDIARRWQDLAERRLAHYNDLYRSGRWRHYYATEKLFALRMHDVIRSVKIWRLIAEATRSAPRQTPLQRAANRGDVRTAA